MGKLLLSLSLLSLIFTGIGTIVAPNDSMFWLATNSAVFQHVRVLIGMLLAIQLVTRPPRHLWFRILAGSIAAFTAAWAIQQTYSYHMQLLDTLAFLGAACAVFATSLERNLNTIPAVTIHNKVII